MASVSIPEMYDDGDEYSRDNHEEKMHLNYKEIEKRRKEKVDELAHGLLLQRKKINKNIEEELNRYPNRDTVFETEERLATKEMPNVQMLEDMKSSEVPVEDVPVHGDTSMPEIGNAMSETRSTNLFFSEELILKFVLNKDYIEVEENIKQEKLVIVKEAQISIRMQINKRLSQVCGKPGQVERIFEVLKEYSHLYIFIEIFTLKVIEQGRLQVSSSPDSYREFSELFCRLYSPEMMNYFRVILFTKSASTDAMKGMYSIYFGILEIQRNADEAWFFIASLFNSKQNEASCYVVEHFFLILGNLLFNTCRGPFLRLIDYAKQHYLCEMDNDPCRLRLTSIFSIYCA